MEDRKQPWTRTSHITLGKRLEKEAYTDLSLSYSFLDMSLISRYRYIWCFIALYITVKDHNVL